MSLNHLRTFIEAFRCHSLSEAAENLGITQPAVSQHIASLEAQLGKSVPGMVMKAGGFPPARAA